MTIQPVPGEIATVRSVSSYTFRVNGSASPLRLQGLRISSGACNCPAAGGVVDLYGSGHEVIGNEIFASSDNGIYTDDVSSNITIRGNSIHDNGTVLDGNQDHGIYLQGFDHLVENNVIRDQPQGFGIQMYDNGARNVVRSNTIDHSGYGRPCCGGLVVGGGSSGDYRDVEIYGNTITRSQGADISNDNIDGDCTGDIHDNDVEKPISGFPVGCAVNNFGIGTPPIEDGGSTYCSPPLNGYTGYIGGWPVRCQYSAGWGGYWSSYDGWVFGCGQYGGYCWHWARY